MHAKRKTDLAPMVQVMLQHVPDDPAPLVGIGVTLAHARECVSEILRSKARERRLHRLPSGRQALYQLIGYTRRSMGAVPLMIGTKRFVAFAEDVVEPPCPHSNDMASQLLNGAQLWCGSERQLLRGQGGES